MAIVFYCYGIRFEQDSFPQLLTPMFFPVPPTIGQKIQLYPSEKLAEIRKIDHHHMIIDVTPIQIAEAVV
ncbi:MAG: hypothetical protein AAF579_10255 [Cyanobacteria bacterium P01_C01_bin.118]